MHMDCTADAVSGCRVIACSCVCLQPLTHRPKLFLRCTSQPLVPGLQCLPSSGSGMSVILPSLLYLQRVVVADLVPCPAEARLPPQGRLSSSSSWPRELGQPAPPGGAGHGLEYITPPHKRPSFSCPAGLLHHHDPPLLLFFFPPLGESSESRQGAVLRQPEDVEHPRQVHGKVWAISPLRHSGSLEEVKEFKGEARRSY